MELTREQTKKTLRPRVGPILSDFQGELIGEIPGNLHLEPSEPVSGELVFIEEVSSGEGDAAFGAATIVIIDAQDNEHRFATDVHQLTWK